MTYSDQSIRIFLRDNVPNTVLRNQLLNLFEGVRDLAYRAGQREAQGQSPRGRPPAQPIMRVIRSAESNPASITSGVTNEDIAL